jgi:hypothetical protein
MTRSSSILKTHRSITTRNNAVSKTKDVDKPEAVIFSDKIVAEDSAGYLIAADGFFVSEKLDPVRPVVAPGPIEHVHV